MLRIAAAMRDVDGIEVHAGIHHGVAVFHDGDYFGRAVNLAARLLGSAGAGEIMASEDVARATAEYPWRHRGPTQCEALRSPLTSMRSSRQVATRQSTYTPMSVNPLADVAYAAPGRSARSRGLISIDVGDRPRCRG